MGLLVAVTYQLLAMDETKTEKHRVSHNSSEINNSGDNTNSTLSDEPAYPSLSKARQIALVVVLASSGFLNVSSRLVLNPQRSQDCSEHANNLS